MVTRALQRVSVEDSSLQRESQLPDAHAPGAPDAPTCTGKTYDPCTDGSQYNGVAVACNMMGNCKPPSANLCAR